MPPNDLLKAMRRDWDRRAKENARHYIANGRDYWSDDDFIKSGEQTVAELILNDMANICQGKAATEMQVLEIGCGTGRVTRALAKLFGSVHAVDVSGEMVKLARLALAAAPNAFIYQNNGRDLSVLGDLRFDFAFSTCVFHHIPSKEIVQNYVYETGLRLRPGSLFKFEVQGYLGMHPAPDDTWLGTPFSEQEMRTMAECTGFEPRYMVGAGEERFWLWFFKR